MSLIIIYENIGLSVEIECPAKVEVIVRGWPASETRDARCYL